MLRRLLAYLEKHFALSDHVDALRDERQSPQIPPQTIFWSVLTMFALRLGSLNALEQELRRPKRWEYLLGPKKPSADTVGYALARWSMDELRALVQHLNRQAWRSKAIHMRPRQPLRVIALDGHELFCSDARCCERCLVREVERDGQTILQYYHRIVVAQWVGVTPPGILDVELLQPGEGEVVAAKRLLKRVLRHYDRLVDVICADALYLEAPFLKLVLHAGKYFLIVLNQENREIYRDVEALRRLEPCQEVDDGPRRHYRVWDFAALESFTTLESAVRVVWSEETVEESQRRGGKEHLETMTSTWSWVTNLPAWVTPLEVRQWGHDRWDLENRGFNELVNLWGMDHCFKHDPTAIEALLLILAIAFLTTYLFYERNLKPPVRQGLSRLALARRLYEDLLLWDRPAPWKVPEASPG
jgi:hypothetical protein